MVYRTYNMLQDGQENYVYGLFDQFSARGHDAMLERAWARQLARLYTPARYLFHTLQMGSAYLCQIAPASTISNCATYQTADTLRWLTHTAYRTKELANGFDDLGFGDRRARRWESDPAWQGFRELVEKGLATYDWAEELCRDEPRRAACGRGGACCAASAASARHNGDTLLGLLTDAQLVDADRHRRWTGALVKMALESEANKAVFDGWVAKWAPLGDAAIDAYAAHLPDAPGAAKKAKQAAADWRKGWGLTRRVIAGRSEAIHRSQDAAIGIVVTSLARDEWRLPTDR